MSKHPSLYPHRVNPHTGGRRGPDPLQHLTPSSCSCTRAQLLITAWLSSAVGKGLYKIHCCADLGILIREPLWALAVIGHTGEYISIHTFKWLIIFHPVNVMFYLFTDSINTYMSWTWRWRAGSAPGPWGPPGSRYTPPLASDRSAQRRWWCWAAVRSSLHHCPAKKIVIRKWCWREHTGACVSHISNTCQLLSGVNFSEWEKKKWIGQWDGNKASSCECNNFDFMLSFCSFLNFSGSLADSIPKMELLCRNELASSCDVSWVTFCCSSMLHVSKGLSLIHMEPPRYSQLFSESQCCARTSCQQTDVKPALRS